jgi:hypothetical protein
MTVVMKYARCQVLPGAFDSELYVIVGDVSALVDKGSVKTDDPVNGVEVSGAVLVHLIAEKSNQVLVELPGQAVVGSLRTWVPKETLVAA